MDKKPDFKVIWQEILAQAYQEYIHPHATPATQGGLTKIWALRILIVVRQTRGNNPST